jgi:hypothetical protein
MNLDSENSYNSRKKQKQQTQKTFLMKSKKSFIILLIGIFSLGAYAQDFVPPADGNAVV